MKRGRYWQRSAIAMAVFVLMVVWRPSFDARVAVEKKVGQAEGFSVVEMIGEKKVAQNRSLVLYLSEKGEIDCAAVKHTLGIYQAEAVFGYIPARDSGAVESGQNRAHLLYCPYGRGDWYLCYGVVADQEVAQVMFGDQRMDEFQYGGVRIVYCWGAGSPDGKFVLKDARGRELDMVKQ
ncbi:MAG: hypothetical protein KH230_06710 [Enterocloster asparagiformis]|nr:hypothetical protein [Enterocloster asparagiformis]